MSILILYYKIIPSQHFKTYSASTPIFASNIIQIHEMKVNENEYNKYFYLLVSSPDTMNLEKGENGLFNDDEYSIPWSRDTEEC